ncbi:hypothetical protein CSIM01_06808 [Colletotrichum simmondsii]|uniref:Uncharacterized protein n=1 Tax=Colletotrichum simmondsii TaxID=703756 RepID=A0A135TEZ1_9PEZI|nr:hypothetical protein CSIM01_06808 [Colletotrichum simmondsii]
MPMNVDMFCTEEGQLELLMGNSPADVHRPACYADYRRREVLSRATKTAAAAATARTSYLLCTYLDADVRSRGPADPKEWEHEFLQQQQQRSRSTADAKQVPCPVLPCPALFASPTLYLSCSAALGGAADGRSTRSNLDLERTASRPPLCPPPLVDPGRQGKPRSPEPAGPPRRIEDFRRDIKSYGEFRNNRLDDSKSITVVKTQDPRPKKSWDKEHGAQSAEARSKLKAGAVDPSRLREIARRPEEEEAYHYRWTPRSPLTHRRRSGWATANELEMIDIIPLLVQQDCLPQAASVFLPTDFPRHIDRVPKLSSPVYWEGKKTKKVFRQLGGLSPSCQCHSPMSVTEPNSKDHPYFPSPIKRAQIPHYHDKGRPFKHTYISTSRAGQGLEVLAPEKRSLAVVDEKPMSMLPDPGCPSSSALLGSSPPPNPAERCPQLLKSLSDLTKNLAAAVTVREGGGKKRRRLVRLSCIELNPSIRLERGEEEKSQYEALLWPQRF